VNECVLVGLAFLGIVLALLLQCKNIMILWTRKSESTLPVLGSYKRKAPLRGPRLVWRRWDSNPRGTVSRKALVSVRGQFG